MPLCLFIFRTPHPTFSHSLCLRVCTFFHFSNNFDLLEPYFFLPNSHLGNCLNTVLSFEQLGAVEAKEVKSDDERGCLTYRELINELVPVSNSGSCQVLELQVPFSLMVEWLLLLGNFVRRAKVPSK